MSDQIRIGRKGYFDVALETSPGTGGESPDKRIPYTANTIHNVVEVLDDEAAKGVRERAWGSTVARTRGEGDITAYVDVENLPYLLFPALGTCVTGDVTAGSSYQHTFTRKDANPPTTICMQVNDTYETREYHYGTANTLEITFSDGWIESTTGIISKAAETASGDEASISEENVLAFNDANIYFGDSIIQAEGKYLAGTGATKLTAFTITINNNAEAQYASGSESPSQISMGQFEVSGNYTLFLENSTERAAHEAQTYRAMVISLKTGSNVTGTSDAEEILIEIPKFHITDRGIDTAPAGFVTENPTFVADYTETYGSIIVKIINGSSAYTGCIESSSSSCSSSSSSCSSSSSFSSSSSSTT